jgi:hypothetical protein
MKIRGSLARAWNKLPRWAQLVLTVVIWGGLIVLVVKSGRDDDPNVAFRRIMYGEAR